MVTKRANKQSILSVEASGKSVEASGKTVEASCLSFKKAYCLQAPTSIRPPDFSNTKLFYFFIIILILLRCIM